MDPRDYADPACPFDASAWRESASPRTPKARLSLAPILERYDAHMARGEKAEAGRVLEDALALARQCGDEKSELSILSELMGYYRQAGSPERGLEAVEKGFALLASLGLEGTATAGTILVNGATALSAAGQPEKALRAYEQAFRCFGQTIPPEDARFAALFNNMAAAYAAAGKPEQAAAHYRGALAVLAHHPDNPDAAVTHINLAQLYAGTDPEKTDVELALAIEALDSPDLIWNEYYAYTCLKCASAFAEFGMDEQMKDMRERAEIIHEHAGD